MNRSVEKISNAFEQLVNEIEIAYELHIRWVLNNTDRPSIHLLGALYLRTERKIRDNNWRGLNGLLSEIKEKMGRMINDPDQYLNKNREYYNNHIYKAWLESCPIWTQN